MVSIRSPSTTGQASSAAPKPSAPGPRSEGRSPTPTASHSAPSPGACPAASSSSAGWASWRVTTHTGRPESRPAGGGLLTLSMRNDLDAFRPKRLSRASSFSDGVDDPDDQEDERRKHPQSRNQGERGETGRPRKGGTPPEENA